MPPIHVDADNSTRLRWNNRSRFVLGSIEHYGSILNTAFDYATYWRADRLLEHAGATP